MFIKALTLLLFCSTLGSVLLALHYHKELDRLQNKQIKSISMAKALTLFSNNLRIATYPTACDTESKAILGEDCDLGNYMEWAGPHLEEETRILLEFLKENADR